MIEYTDEQREYVMAQLRNNLVGMLKAEIQETLLVTQFELVTAKLENDRLRAELAQARRWAAAWKNVAQGYRLNYWAFGPDMIAAEKRIWSQNRRQLRRRRAESRLRGDPGKPIL